MAQNKVGYVPGFIPADSQEQARAINEELVKISAVFQVIIPGFVEELNVAPGKPRTGDTRLADGTNWNPGAGQGVYTFYNNTWNKLG